MHSHLSCRRKVTPALLAWALGLFSDSVFAAGKKSPGHRHLEFQS
jgi:hypothetical protein